MGGTLNNCFSSRILDHIPAVQFSWHEALDFWCQPAASLCKRGKREAPYSVPELIKSMEHPHCIIIMNRSRR